MELSVIIPAYNAAPTLAECLTSVVGTGAEIIVVDDGSADGTSELAAGFSGVRLVSRPNGGVSAARNTGLEQAQGEYVVFVDADDVLMSGALEKLSATLDGQADVIVMRSFAKISGHAGKERYPWGTLFADGTDCGLTEIDRTGYLRGSVCGCAFRKEFLKASGLRFAEGLPLSEDLVFFSRCLAAGARIRFRDIPFYEIHGREDSASKKIDGQYVRRYSLALPVAYNGIADPALKAATCRSIIMGMIHVAAPAGYTPARLWKEAGLGAVLPLPVVPESPYKRSIRLMNDHFALFFRLKQMKDLCLHR